MKIETIEVAGLAGALTALRLPFGLGEKSVIRVTLPFAEELIFVELDKK